MGLALVIGPVALMTSPKGPKVAVRDFPVKGVVSRQYARFAFLSRRKALTTKRAGGRPKGAGRRVGRPGGNRAQRSYGQTLV